MARDIEKKVFAGGGLDSNTAFEYVDVNDYIDATNIRTISAKDNQDGYVVPLEGTDLRTNPNWEPGDTVVKSRYFTEIGRLVQFVHSTTNNHRVEEYDPITMSHTVLVQGSVLNLQLDLKVKDIKLVDNKYLLWNDAFNEVRMINRDRALNGEYIPLTEDDINLSKQPPIHEPKVRYADHGSINLIKGNLYQFRSQYIYEDGEPSAWSPISQREVPEEESDPTVATDSTKNNTLVVSVDIGNKRVKEIITAARAGDSDWFVVDRTKREDILLLPNVVLPDTFYVQAYDPVTGLYSFIFKNEGLYEYVDVLETDLLHDYIPRQAKALEVLNKNVVALGSTLEGYPRPDISPTIYPDFYAIEDPDTGEFQLGGFGSTYAGNGLSNNHIDFFGDAPLVGDSVLITFRARWVGTPPKPDQYSSGTYTFTSADIAAGTTVALQNMMTYFKDNVTSSIQNVSVTGSWDINYEMFSANSSVWLLVSNIAITSTSLAGDIISVPSFKKGTSYQLALAHYDKYGRAFPISTGTNYIVEIPFAERGLGVKMVWNLTGATPPEGAVTYRWLLTPNTRYANWVTAVGLYSIEKSTADTAVFDITSLMNFSKAHEGSPITYEYSEGDRANIQVLSYEWKDVEVRKVEIEGEKFYLHTGVPYGVVMEDITYAIEIYTPRKATTDNQGVMVYYEVDEVYDIVDGEYGTISGEITGADNYIKKRSYKDGTTTITTTVEDPNFSDFYPSKFYSYGRPRTYYDTPEEELLKARIRYSREFIKGERADVNMLTRFYGENYEDYDDIYGNIWYLSVRNNTLVCIQEKNTGYIGVERQIIEDSIGQQNIAVSEKLLNKIEYTRGKNTGIGNAIHSFVETYGTIYFIDPMREEVVRVGLDGIIPIGYRYSNKLRELVRETKDTGNQALTLYEGVYNNRYEEYMVTFNGISEPGTYIFSENLDKWQSHSQMVPTCGTSADNRLYTFNGGNLYEHTDSAIKSNFYGIQYYPTLKVVYGGKAPDQNKTFQSIEIESDKLFVTTENGIESALGQVTDLIEEDFEISYMLEREGIYKANIPRDNTDPINGDRVKGRYATFDLFATDPDFRLFTTSVLFDYSPPNH